MIGTILNNRYELLEKIGEGGMAEVYKAKCHKLNRYDAVKILKRDYANDPVVVEKFKHEATAVANLSDNNIINIFDVGSQGDINYIVMEYVKGKTLKDIIQQNVRLSYERAIDIAIQIAKALDCAHRNNIIHRDVKPQNILLTEEGIVKVTDFGIAKASSSVTITNSNKVIGSAHYFSPEQARGNYVDARTDVYSLGIVLYEMVTGKLPFDAESPVTIALKHLQDNAVPAKQLNSSIPDNLNILIIKCMEKDPNNRYQNVRELLMDLLRIQKDFNYEIIPTTVEKDYTRVMEPVNVPQRIEDDEIDEPKVNNKTKRYLLIALAAILVVALGALAGWLATRDANKQSGGKSTDIRGEIEVPNVIGKTETDAKKAIEDAGFTYFKVDEVHDDKIPSGSVVTTFPEPGTKSKAKADVRVRLSKGPGKNNVPQVQDLDVQQAKIMIETAGFIMVVADKQYHDTIPENFVISQTPTGNSAAEKGAEVKVIVSLGKKFVLVEVPDLKGKTLQEADTLLTTAKLKLGTKTAVPTSDEDKIGKIFEQNIVGTRVEENTAINVKYYIQEEDKTVIVPNLKGKTIEEAETILANFKLKLGKKVAVPAVKEEDEGKIFEWTPTGGTSVTEGDTIDVKYYEEKQE